MQMQVRGTYIMTQDIFDDIVQRNSDAISKHENDMHSVHMTISDLKRFISELNDGEMKSIILAVASLHNEVVSLLKYQNLLI